MTILRGAVIKLVGVLILGGCTYGPPVYHGEMKDAALLGDGRVAIAYSQVVSRHPTGIAAFLDGGTAQILHNQLLLALVDRDGALGRSHATTIRVVREAAMFLWSGAKPTPPISM